MRAGQVDGCGFRVDVHVEDAVHAGEDASRLNLVGAWREATVFTDAVRECVRAGLWWGLWCSPGGGCTAGAGWGLPRSSRSTTWRGGAWRVGRRSR
ncbi:carboxymuconolactone decarboxylase family protein [Kitasatospora sp. NPDC001683]